MNEVKAKRLNKELVSLVKPYMPNKKPALTPQMKEDLKKEVNKMLEAPPQPQELLESLDSSFENFFSQRPFTLSNFNLLLKVISKQGKLSEALYTLEKMSDLGLRPNLYSYIHLITVAGKANQTQLAESMFDEALKVSEPTDFLYTALISSYTSSANYTKIEALMREKQDKGFIVNAVDVTNYIHAHVRANNAAKALEIFKTWQTKVQVDEYMLTMGIRACSKCNEAEYALILWGRLESMGFPEVAYHYNEIIMALAKRQDYSEQALDIYGRMRAAGIVPDTRTFNAVLTACARLGDLFKAREMLVEMKTFEVEMDKTKYGLLMSCYAEACFQADEDAKDVFIKESWELFKQCEAQNCVDTLVVNSLLSVHTKAYREDQVEGLVLPLYEQYNLKKDKHTYRHLMTMYTQLNDPEAVNNLWKSLNEEKVKPDMFILNSYLTTSLKVSDTDRVVEALERFKKENFTPLHHIIKKLNESEDKPLRVWGVLQHFKNFYSDLAYKNPKFTYDEKSIKPFLEEGKVRRGVTKYISSDHKKAQTKLVNSKKK